MSGQRQMRKEPAWLGRKPGSPLGGLVYVWMVSAQLLGACWAGSSAASPVEPRELFRHPTNRGTGTGTAVTGADGIVDLSTSECFNRPQAKILEFANGHYIRPLVVKGSVRSTLDLRGVKIDANVGPINPNRFPLIFDNPDNTCVVGATVQGQQSRTLTWAKVKHFNADRVFEGDGISWANPTGRFIVEGAWIDNMEDGFGPPFDYVPSRSSSFSLRHIYARHLRDDVIENDGCLNGELTDSFLDGIWTFHSSRPSAEAKGIVTGNATLKVRNVVMRHECQADDRNMNETSCPAGMNIGQLDKGSGDCRLRVDMQDSVIMMESARAGDAFAAGTYRNVTLVWAGRGPWPGAPLPAGVNLTTNRANYERAKTSWLGRHGCDPSENNCRYLQHDKINQTPPALTRPFVQMINWPRFMTAKDGGGNGSGIQWWAENVSSCRASGEQFTPGAAKTGSQHIKLVQPGTVDFRLSCTGSNGISVSDATRGIWITPRSSREMNKPSVPSMVQAVPALGKINVKWDESRDDSGIASYRIYRDGEWITSVSGSLSFADRDIIGNRTYSYQIEAFDVFGNLSGLSLRAQARTGAR